MRNRQINILLLVVVLAFVFGCGKKTEPIAKSDIILPEPVNAVIKNTEKGVQIYNPDKKHPLVITRGVHSGGKCGKLSHIGNVDSEGYFVDTDVIEGKAYTYILRSLNVEYKLVSKPVENTIVYSTPIVITAAASRLVAKGLYEVNIQLNKDPLKISVISDGKVVKYTAKKTFTLKDEKIKSGRIELVAYDKYNNKGQETELVVYKVKPVLDAPTNLKYFVKDGKVTLSWDEPSAGSHVYAVYYDDKRIGVTSQPFLTFEGKKGCFDASAATVKGGFESEKATVKVCR